MQAGKLRHRVTIQEATESVDSYGQPTFAWADEATVWASIEPLRGQERLAQQQIESDVTHRVTLRYLTNLTPAKRIKFGSRYLEIRSVMNVDEHDETMVLECHEAL